MKRFSYLNAWLFFIALFLAAASDVQAGKPRTSADAGIDQTVMPGELVTLNGTGYTTAKKREVTYHWLMTAKPGGSTAALVNEMSRTPNFTADKAGEYVIKLVVRCGNGKPHIAEDTVTVVALGTVEDDPVNETPDPGQRTLVYWNLASSPYELTRDVQIPSSEMLVIEPGVVVNGNGHAIQVWGVLSAQGTSSAPVTFNAVHIRPGTNNYYEPWYSSIDLQHARINGGSLYSPTGNAIYGNLILKDSVLSKVPYLYVWYPTSDCFIERNIFLNSGGVSVGVNGSIKVYITNNVFYNQQTAYVPDGEFAVSNWASYNGSDTIVLNNSFLSTDKVALRLPSNYESAKMTAIGNFWNTTDTRVIDAMIFDRNDDLASIGYIKYLPILTAPHADTPDPAPYLMP